MRTRQTLLATLILSCALPLSNASAAEPRQRMPLAWPAGPFEVRLALETPVSSTGAESLLGKPIAFDVAPPPRGDAPREQPPTSSTHKGAIRLVAVEHLDEGRTLVLSTDPHPREAEYALDVPRTKDWGPLAGQTIRYDLSGVEVAWAEPADNAAPAWTGWWPSLDSREARRAMAGSVQHDRLWALLAKPGKLTLGTLLKLPAGKHELRIESSGTIQKALLGGEAGEESSDPHRARFNVEFTGDPIDLSLKIATGEGPTPFRLRVTDTSGEPQREQAIPRDQLTVTWAPPSPAAASNPPAPPDLAGGDPTRGEAVFFGQDGKCSGCHAFRGKGGTVGPDLGEVYRRPLAEVYRDIAEPSTSINPEYVPYTVALKDGRVLAGVVRAEGAGKVKVTDTEAKATVVDKTEIEALRPSATSIMPVGLVGVLGEARTRDILAYLMARPSGTPRSATP